MPGGEPFEAGSRDGERCLGQVPGVGRDHALPAGAVHEDGDGMHSTVSRAQRPEKLPQRMLLACFDEGRQVVLGETQLNVRKRKGPHSRSFSVELGCIHRQSSLFRSNPRGISCRSPTADCGGLRFGIQGY